MAIARRKRKTTGGFREYCCREEEAPTRGPARKAYVASIMDGVLNLLGLAQDKVKQTISFLATEQTTAHVRAGRPLPKAARSRIKEAYYKVNSAHACFTSGGIKEDIDDTKGAYGMTLVLDQAQHLYAAVDQNGAFSRDHDGPRYLATLQRGLSQLQDTLLHTHVSLVPYAQVASVATVPPPPTVSAPTVIQPTREEIAAQNELAPFLEQLRSKGWKTQERKRTTTMGSSGARSS